MRSVLNRSIFAASLAAVSLLAAPAMAKSVTGGSALSAAGGGASSLSAASMTTVVTFFPTNLIFSNDGLGAAINEVFFVPLAPGATLTGIGWDVELFADSPSWLSEMVVTFGTTSTPWIVDLTPGLGDNFPGVGNYSSGGVVDLVGLGLSFDVDADGLLRLEFWESFIDFPNDWDGIWVSGGLTLQYSVPGGAIPEPGTWAMLIAGFGLVGFAARRRRETATA
jgi:hypothetical protein